MDSTPYLQAAQLIVAVQALFPHGQAVFLMQAFSFLGTEPFFLLLIPALYWCIEAEVGMQVGVVLVFSAALNNFLKLFFHAPRPYWLFPLDIDAFSAESSFGLPSGHAQIAAALWGTLAASIRRPWAWAVALALTGLIGFSRMYLGVHFVSDVLVGWGLGILFLLFFLRFWNPLRGWFFRQSLALQALTAAGISLLFLLLVLQVMPSAYPQVWYENAYMALGGEDTLPNPLEADTIISTTGLMFGLLFGLGWQEKHGGFHVSGSWQKRALRYLLGIVGLVLLWKGLGAFSTYDDSIFWHVYRYLRYALLGVWVTAGAPWLFARLKLTEM